MISALFSRTPAAVQDVVLLVVRVGLGIVLVAHGWQKVSEGGLSGTADGFAAMGIPLPTAAAAFAIAVELGGGIALVVGALTPVVGVLVALTMAGAWWYAHRDGGLFVAEGGFEYVAVLGLLALALAAVGPGRLSIDGVLGRHHEVGGTADPAPATGAAPRDREHARA